MTRRELLLAPAALLTVDTPAHRERYLKSMLHFLCDELGPRPAGSPACERGIQAIRREMEKALPRVALDTLSFTRWELVGAPEMQIDGRTVETIVAYGSPATPEAGVRGAVRKGNARYDIVDPATGKVLARIGLGSFGPAVASRYLGTDNVPLFNVGQQDAPLLDKAKSVFARARVKLTPGTRTSSVVGTLPGATAEEIVIVAHADTVYNAPGASDNTATAICMLMLAQAMSGSRPRRTVTFLATTGEEIGYLGAIHYGKERARQGTLGRVKVCVNLDSLTYGPNLQITTTDKELAKMIVDLHGELGIHASPKVIERDDTMDSAPFHAAGARTVHLNSRGYDRMLPLNHRPDDKADTIDPQLIEQSFRILLELARRLSA